MNPTKQKIINEGIELFSKKGYTETSIRDIVSRIPIQTASFYNHFPSKNALLDHIFQMYISNTIKNTPSVEVMEHLIHEADARTVFGRFFFTFQDDTAETYSKILKIFLQEQYRNEEVNKFMRSTYIMETEDTIKELLDKLIAAKKIAPVNTAAYAKIINSLNLAATMEFALYPAEEYFHLKRPKREDALSVIIDTLVSAPVS